MAAARMQRNTLEIRIAAVEQKILEVEADISKAEAKAEKAEADEKAEDLRYWRNEKAQLRGKESQLRDEEHQLRAEKARIEVQPQVQVALPDSSRADCARMLGGLPPVPRSIDDFQQYLLTGAVALTPSFHSFLIAERPDLQNNALAAASENSFLAQTMTVLVRGYRSAAGHNEEVIGQRMTAFTTGIWTALRDATRDVDYQYNLQYDRNKRPNRCIADSETSDDSDIVESIRPDLIVSVNGLLMFLGEERPSPVGRHEAVHDIDSELGHGLPAFPYQEIPHIPVYAAAGDEIQFGLVLRGQDGQQLNDKVEMSQRVYNLTSMRDRVECLAASVAIYRLFASLLKLAPVQEQRLALWFPMTRPLGHSTYVSIQEAAAIQEDPWEIYQAMVKASSAAVHN